MQILALDVGFRNTGWVVFSADKPIAAGVIKTSAEEKRVGDSVSAYYAACCRHIAAELRAICEGHNICAIVGELPTGGSKSGRAASMMSMALATVVTAAKLMHIPAVWTTPIAGKKALAGSNTADKREMMAAAVDRFGGALPPTPRGKYYFAGELWTAGAFEHIADAAAAYIAAKKG